MEIFFVSKDLNPEYWKTSEAEKIPFIYSSSTKHTSGREKTTLQCNKSF